MHVCVEHVTPFWSVAFVNECCRSQFLASHVTTDGRFDWHWASPSLDRAAAAAALMRCRFVNDERRAVRLVCNSFADTADRADPVYAS